ncbi:hypothetical protein FHX44_11604 [Pseudonocardia hierapolitana]|uniref:Uncharacterized protein n=1 Tax=Pseudonocardia hierapolitana TaxID=1128676 RepID=A0A561SIT6_9PSEU|nr:hypothetical protein [Pseudonocardia hierapolitana]TWF74722.1 hypothetical protein FHX44_11604 [Pseudonocardia hierapolitana]
MSRTIPSSTVVDTTPTIEPADLAGPELPRIDAIEALLAAANGVAPPLVAPASPLQAFKILRQGCYLLTFRPLPPTLPLPGLQYAGTMRVEHGTGAHGSGDLYLRGSTRPDPRGGVPSFPLADYRYYLMAKTFSPVAHRTLTFTFERHLFDHVTRTWSNQGEFTAQMVWVPAPPAFPDAGQFLVGLVTDPMGIVTGSLSMGWVADELRRMTIEIDRVAVSEPPTGDSTGTETWSSVFARSKWRADVAASNTNLTQPSGDSWSDAELHAQLLASRDQNDLNAEWRYMILAVRRLDSTERGIMFDAFATDSNNVPREGAALSSHWVIPNDPQWGTTAGQRFGTQADPYFRTAVHELGHALNLIHEESEGIAGTTFMTTTPTIVAAGTATQPFPTNITWDFHPTNKHRIKHWPDIYVRPGGLPFASAHTTTPLATADAVADRDDIRVDVIPVRSSFPIGAPVRVEVRVTNIGIDPLPFPTRLRYEGGHIEGTVTAPGGAPRPFRSIVRCLDDGADGYLDPGESRVAGLTLLRGPDGPLFATSGSHAVDVAVLFTGHDGLPARARGSAAVWVDHAARADHAEAAARVLASPDLSVVVALGGGDHLDDGVSALSDALADSTLHPHYEVTEALRTGRPFQDRAALTADAADVVTADVVATGDEIAAVARALARRRSGAADAVRTAMRSLRAAAAGTADARDVTDRIDGSR